MDSKKVPDPTYCLRLLSIINKMRNHKQRASSDRIVYFMGSRFGLAEADVLKELNLAVNASKIKKFIGIKGKESYRDARYPHKIPIQSFVRKHSADLRMLVANSIETLNTSNGSKISAIEEHIRSTHALDLSRADLTSQLKLAVSHGVKDNLFVKSGPLVTIVWETLEHLRQKEFQSFFAEGVEPSPVCGFCLGTSECNKERLPEQLLSCVDCGNSGHPSCLKFSDDLTRQCMSEPWQCIECKVCSFCQCSGDADNLLFCDSCDKGFHMDCLRPPMSKMPTGFWMCCLCDKVGDTPSKPRKRKKVVGPATPITPNSNNLLQQTPVSEKKRAPKTLKKTDEASDTDGDFMADVRLIQGIIKAEEKKKKVKIRNKLLNVGECGSSPKGSPKSSPRGSRKGSPKPSVSKRGKESCSKSSSPEKLTGPEKRDTVKDCDQKMFDEIIEQCNKSLKISPADTTGQRSPEFIDFGKYEIETWYSSPLPFEYSRLSKLYFCEYCLKYMKGQEALSRHQLKCSLRQPPANEIYRHDNISLYEVDGAKNKLYCRNLCLLAKMFLDHKTLYYDVEPFLFYVLTLNDEYGSHLVGYFSKEKNSIRNNNLACIMTLPHTQRQGYGKLLIDFSYILSKVEGKPGTPEKPLSDLGLISYRSYWRHQVLTYINSHPDEEIIIADISKSSGILSEDLVLALHDLQMLEFDEENNNFFIKIDQGLAKEKLRISSQKNFHIIKEDALIWSPVVSPMCVPHRYRRNTENSGSPRKSGMLLSPMKIVKKASQVDPLEEVVPTEPRSIDTFTRYYPNWIPAGEDADEYRYAGEEMKGEIESFVMKKTPGKKKRVKFAVVYNPKSGKRVTKAIPQKKRGPKGGAHAREEPETSIIMEEEKEGELEEQIEDLDMETKLFKTHSPAISYNEVSSTSDIQDLGTEVKSLVEQEDGLPHSTTEDPVHLAADTTTQGDVEGERKREYSSESDSGFFPSSKKQRLENSPFYSDSETDEDEEMMQSDTKMLEHSDDDVIEEEEEESSSLFLNTYSNIYVKTCEAIKPSDSTVLPSKDS